MSDRSAPTAREEWPKDWSVVGFAQPSVWHIIMSPAYSSWRLKPNSDGRGGDISKAATFGMICTLTAPVIVRYADRLGAHRVAVACITAMVLCVVALSTMTGTYWHFLAISTALGVIVLVCTTLIYGWAVNSWFDLDKDMALGNSSIAMALATWRLRSRPSCWSPRSSPIWFSQSIRRA
jgi:hypothetical protein